MQDAFPEPEDGLGQTKTKSTPQSASVRVDTTPSQSTVLWGTLWARFFPLETERGRSQWNVSHFLEVGSFAAAHFTEIYGAENEARPRFLWRDSSEAKARYYESNVDCFLLTDRGNPAGIFVGNPSDWSTYYIRNISLRPAYQGMGHYSKFLTHLIHILTASGVERIDTDVAPNNFAHIHLLTKFGFVVSGYQTSERWGALVKFTRFLEKKNQQVYLEQFCHGSGPKEEASQ